MIEKTTKRTLYLHFDIFTLLLFDKRKKNDHFYSSRITASAFHLYMLSYRSTLERTCS